MLLLVLLPFKVLVLLRVSSGTCLMAVLLLGGIAGAAATATTVSASTTVATTVCQNLRDISKGSRCFLLHMQLLKVWDQLPLLHAAIHLTALQLQLLLLMAVMLAQVLALQLLLLVLLLAQILS